MNDQHVTNPPAGGSPGGGDDRGRRGPAVHDIPPQKTTTDDEVIPASEIKVGVLTALIGAPFFIILILKRRGELTGASV